MTTPNPNPTPDQPSAPAHADTVAEDTPDTGLPATDGVDAPATDGMTVDGSDAEDGADATADDGGDVAVGGSTEGDGENEDHLPPGQTAVPVGEEVVIDDDTMRRALEAILMVTDEPLPVLTLARAVGRPTPDVAAALAELAAEYTEQGRGFDLREVGGGWRYYTRVEAAPYVERFVLDGQQARLTQAALETLAVVAYKQPVSRARVSAIRGVNVDGVMRTLVARGLVEEAGSDTESQATLYRTTSYFLERMGMQSLDDLPELAPYLPEMDDIEEELAAQTLPPATPADTESSDTESTDRESTDRESTDRESTDAGATPVVPADDDSADEAPEDSESTDTESTDSESTDSESTDSDSTDSEPGDAVPADGESTAAVVVSEVRNGG
ncbi:SMC-Scp complex subunit ScpB [Kribbella sp. NPDC048915]|uniref:SMC-Scp complex subunit ScpB n=1 Tax=Kribbella sp. NPDC048915 TaxID=3155148 RepID=UPI0033D50E9E